MFITNELTPGEMLAEFLKGRRASLHETSMFAKLRHDKNLCPRFAEQVSMMLDVYRAYGQEVHDIQSIRDDGIDVLLRYQDQDGNDRRAGLQIKSDDEFCKWEADKYPLLSTLKAQYATAISNGKLDEYYILLCVDAVRHKSRIRTVCSELKNFSPVKIIEPQDLCEFYEMSPTELWAKATSLLCHNDTVLKKAIEEVTASSPDIAYFVISLVCFAFEGKHEISSDDLFDLWSGWIEFSGKNDDTRDRLPSILWHLSCYWLQALH